MPYKSTADLPAAVKSLPAGAKKIFMSAFNSAFKEYGEERAFKIAWAAVKNKYKKVGEKWVAKGDSAPLEDSVLELEELQDFGDAQQLRVTGDGYLVASPRVARTGIQLYKGWEVGLPELDTVRVYRPEDEVFHADAMASLAWRPITLDHPSEDVNAANWRKYAVGQSSGEVARDGEFIRVPLVLMDAKAIEAVQGGKAQLSVGYSAVLKWGEGKTADGKVYDAMQTDIRANHVAVVKEARGGHKLVIGDRDDDGEPDSKRRRDMSERERIINLDGVNVSLEDKDGQILERHLAKLSTDMAALKTQLGDAQKTIDTLTAKVTEVTKQVETKDGEIAALNKKLGDAKVTPEQLDQMVKDRLGVVDRAIRVLGDKAKVEGRTEAQIKRDTVEALMGGEAAKGMSDDAINGAFFALTKDDGGNSSMRTGDGMRRISDAFGRPPGTGNNDAATAYYERNKNLSDAWRSPQPQNK